MGDWEDDWDADKTTTRPDDKKSPENVNEPSCSGGKIFGSRGRGFVRPPKPSSRMGEWPPKSENGQRDFKRGSGGRSDSGRFDGGRSDSGRFDGGRSNGGRFDGGRSNGGRFDGGRFDSGRSEGGRFDSGRSEGGRFDSGRFDSGRSEGGRFDSGRSEGGRFDSGRSEGGRFDGGRSEGSRESRKKRSDNFGQRRDFAGRGEEEGNEPRTRVKSTYVPEEPSEDDNEIFGNAISTGINFSKYDDIEVKVSGENVPKTIKSFETAGLHRFLVDLIKRCKYSKPTPIQKYAIPIIMEGRDMMACAQTGSGKTAAFLIPIINRLLDDADDVDLSERCYPRAVIVSPTRELTIQIFNEARKFSRGSFLKVAISYGGTAMFHQIQNIQRGCHILVATPGRLLDFIRRGTVKLSKVKFVVLDEADRMLDMGFLPDMERFLSSSTMTPSSGRQTLMFSATFPEEIQRLAGKFLNDYLFVAVGIIGGACADVEQRIFCVTKFEKRNKVVELLSERAGSKCLIFVEQKRTTDFLATFLCEKNFPSTSIHGDREQREREEALRDFKSGKMDILVATSVAARGLDIKNVAHVVNFDLPKSIDEYVHRIGRTGRVGNRGLATSFYDPDQDRLLAPDLVKVLKQAGQPVPDFLKDVGFGTYSGPSKFGGSDFRQSDIAQARRFTYEEEEW